MREGPASPLGNLRPSWARVVLIVALAFFAAFHLLPWTTDTDLVGWRIWRSILRMPSDWTDVRSLLPTFGLLSSGLLLVASPFLVPAFEASALARNLVLLASILATCSLTGFILWVTANRGGPVWGSGMICLMVAQILHVAGVAMVKRRPPPALPS